MRVIVDCREVVLEVLLGTRLCYLLINISHYRQR